MPGSERRRDLNLLPKAHLHLHFTGSMSIPTLREVAALGGAELPEALTDDIALDVPFDKRGWFRFQRLYDTARHTVTSEEAMRMIVARAAADDAREGSRRLELQVDPTGYADHVGGLQPALEIVLDAAREATRTSGVQVGVIVAASRMKHPLDARALARLAARYAGDGPGEVIGFGLSNNERNGDTSAWEGAFRIARTAGLRSVPHAGELLGPDAIRAALAALHPDRIGHGVRSVEDPRLVDALAARGVPLEVCPASNVHLGVFPDDASVPLRTLMGAGVQVALAADDPLLFLSRLTDQYAIARDVQGFSDPELATLASASIDASFASDADKRRWKAEVDAWLADPPG
ncbi:adenosine deaminase [Propioniciclava tarda]|uniref:Adenosine deaminase n=1 Tax=Propioniciclava tarda TaxID=433330 RepID=A0A4Q9KPV9_PROTD|nr:adenosine deaminase [Propioniciclava tarda]TBT96385.1 adenosine deaminase [Propioniciclava tarda]SMO36878.1 adenosine deaminase [Propioniciclava tarda]